MFLSFDIHRELLAGKARQIHNQKLKELVKITNKNATKLQRKRNEKQSHA